jgi:uncharacterized protein
MDAEAAFQELYAYTKERMEAGGAHSFDHVERVLRLAGRIAREEGADPEVVRFAALLHDMERAAEDRGEIEDHAAASAEAARELLLERGFGPNFVERVASAVLTHRFRNDLRPESLEAQVLSDADKLDAMGALGIGRAYLFGGAHGQRLWSDAPKEERFYPGMDVSDYSPVTEYRLKLSKLKDRMLTQTGKRIADKRHAFMEAFFEELEREVRGED